MPIRKKFSFQYISMSTPHFGAFYAVPCQATPLCGAHESIHFDLWVRFQRRSVRLYASHKLTLEHTAIYSEWNQLRRCYHIQIISDGEISIYCAEPLSQQSCEFAELSSMCWRWGRIEMFSARFSIQTRCTIARTQWKLRHTSLYFHLNK